MGDLWEQIRSTALGVLEAGLSGLHALFEPLAGVHAWGFAIIGLTIVIRVLLLPLAIKQIRSMRAMQSLQPKMKEIQKKYKVDRELMRKDPDTYRAKKQKLNEEMMALYQEEGVNPAASCLPLLAQAPVFIALFWLLRTSDDIANQPFYFFTSRISPTDAAPETGLGALVSNAGWPGILLIVLMIVTMFVMQKQMMARQAASGADNPMAQQQKIMLYVLPVFLGVISWNLPLGVLLYWVTTNAWQGVQQAIMMREVHHEAETGTLADHPGGGKARGAGKGKGATPASGGPTKTKGGSAKGGSGSEGPGAGGDGTRGKGSDAATGGKGSAKPAGGKGSGKTTGGKGSGAAPKAGPAKGTSSTGGKDASGSTNGRSSSNGGGSSNGGPRGRSRSGHLPRRPSSS